LDTLKHRLEISVLADEQHIRKSDPEDREQFGDAVAVAAICQHVAMPILDLREGRRNRDGEQCECQLSRKKTGLI
jgi:hypothetical protein